MQGYRRQHEKALCKVIDRIVEMILAKEIDLQTDIDLWKAAPETMEKLARIQDLSSRRYQTKLLKREVKKILIDSKNLLVATIVERMDN
jgi:microsomal dipeptidase-like Zn-dependent dipeptidase